MAKATYQPDCDKCNGLCCRHIALELGKPSTKQDFDNIRWYLMHTDIQVGVDHDGDWLLDVPTVCKHLGKDHRCQIYEERPRICKDYPPIEQTCAHESDESSYKVLFSNHLEFEQYLTKKKIDWKFKKKR